jgi:hypothetical protein
MSYQLVNRGAPDLPSAEATRRSSPPWGGGLSPSLWSATLRCLRKTFHWRPLRAESQGLAQPGWDRQLRRELLRIEARRII